jgi:hypothetical protein
MTIVRFPPPAGFEDFADRLTGLPLSHIWVGHGSAAFFEFGTLRPSKITRKDGTGGNPTGEMTLMIEWSWRIEGARSILCGSWSEAARWHKTFPRLLQATVTAFAPFGRLREIEASLSNGMRIVSFSTVEGGPQWALFHRSSHSWLTVRRGALRVETKQAPP